MAKLLAGNFVINKMRPKHYIINHKFMKRIITIVLSFVIPALLLGAQDYPVVSYDDIEVSKMYVKGNEYQKDLLLYSRTLELTHPHYADPSNAKALRKLTKRLLARESH